MKRNKSENNTKFEIINENNFKKFVSFPTDEQISMSTKIIKEKFNYFSEQFFNEISKNLIQNIAHSLPSSFSESYSQSALFSKNSFLSIFQLWNEHIESKLGPLYFPFFCSQAGIISGINYAKSISYHFFKFNTQFIPKIPSDVNTIIELELNLDSKAGWWEDGFFEIVNENEYEIVLKNSFLSLLNSKFYAIDFLNGYFIGFYNRILRIIKKQCEINNVLSRNYDKRLYTVKEIVNDRTKENIVLRLLFISGNRLRKFNNLYDLYDDIFYINKTKSDNEFFNKNKLLLREINDIIEKYSKLNKSNMSKIIPFLEFLHKKVHEKFENNTNNLKLKNDISNDIFSLIYRLEWFFIEMDG